MTATATEKIQEKESMILCPINTLDFMGPFVHISDLEPTAEEKKRMEEENQWYWTMAKYCGMGLITLAILIDEME